MQHHKISVHKFIFENLSKTKIVPNCFQSHLSLEIHHSPHHPRNEFVQVHPLKLFICFLHPPRCLLAQSLQGNQLFRLLQQSHMDHVKVLGV